MFKNYKCVYKLNNFYINTTFWQNKIKQAILSKGLQKINLRL